MKKLTSIAFAVTAALSLSAHATTVQGHYHGNEGITHIDGDTIVPLTPRSTVTNSPQKLFAAKSYARTASMSKASASSDIVPQTCEPSEFASYSGDDFVEYVSNAYLYNEVQAGYECFRPISIKFDEDTVVFSADNINNVANAIVSELSSGDFIPERIFGKVFFLRVMYYNYMVNGGAHSIPADESNIKAALDAVFDNFDGNSTDETHQLLIAETVIAAGSYYTHFQHMNVANDGSRVAEFVNLVPIMKSRLTAIQDLFTSPGEENQYGLYRAANSIINEYNRMVRYFVGEDVYDDADMPGILAQYIYNINVDDPVPSNAIYALLAMAQIGITDEIVSAVQEVLDETGKFSEPHVALLRSIAEFGVDCDAFGRDDLLCVSDSLIAEMREFALPSTYTFGDITFITKMSEERTRHIYNSLQATRSQFFRNTGITEAVENDPNANPTFVVYGSAQDYKTFHGYLYGLDTNNGGIYIEQDGALYTFDRDDTEMFVLEELARHEYVHFLISRYLVKGMWGETEMYEDNRMVWFDEGMANYLTGAKQYGGIDPLATMIDMKGWHSDRSISEITATSYNDVWMYPFSALLFNYLDSAGSDAVVEMSAALAADDVSEFDSIVSQLSDFDSGFQTYVSDLSVDGWEAPWYAYKVDAELEAANIDEIQTILTDSMGYDATCSEVDESNFSCSFTIEASGIKATQVEIVNSVMDTGIALALSQGQNNFETMTCHPTTFNGETVDAECIGLLRPDHIDYDAGAVDSDGDGVNDDEDAFPNDPTEWADTDGDGVGDNSDAFPEDSTEWEDTDGDGWGNNSDAFPNDSTEWEDTDGDGVGNNSDAFPGDATEWEDTDGDGVGNNSDAFPEDSTEWADTDGDGYGDNSDAFPEDSTEWLDSDGDGHGDNSDAYPNDATKWEQETNTGTNTGGNDTTTTPTTEAKSASGGSFGIWSIFGALGVLLARRKGVDIQA